MHQKGNQGNDQTEKELKSSPESRTTPLIEQDQEERSRIHLVGRDLDRRGGRRYGANAHHFRQRNHRRENDGRGTTVYMSWEQKWFLWTSEGRLLKVWSAANNIVGLFLLSYLFPAAGGTSPTSWYSRTTQARTSARSTKSFFTYSTTVGIKESRILWNKRNLMHH